MISQKQDFSELTMEFCTDLHFMIICEYGLHGQFWDILFWQIIIDPNWSPHTKLEVSGLNTIEVLDWPPFQDHLWVWPPWLVLRHDFWANYYWSQLIPTCKARSDRPQWYWSFWLTSISGSFVSLHGRLFNQNDIITPMIYRWSSLKLQVLIGWCNFASCHPR